MYANSAQAYQQTSSLLRLLWICLLLTSQFTHLTQKNATSRGANKDENCCDTCRENNRQTQNKKQVAKANSMTGTTISRKRRASIGGADGRPTTRPRIDESSEDDGTQTRGDAEREGAELDDDMPGDEEDSQVRLHKEPLSVT
jgi:hypothetical protein